MTIRSRAPLTSLTLRQCREALALSQAAFANRMTSIRSPTATMISQREMNPLKDFDFSSLDV
jgi:hypothetical protein